MPAREHETETASAEPTPEPIAPADGGVQQEFTAEGDLPAIAEGSGAVAGATASELAFDGKQDEAAAAAKDTSHLNRGIHTWEHYRAECEAAGEPDKWKDQYRNGHTGAAGWTQPYDHRLVNDFSLKKGYSASAALQAFLAGPTITDYRCALLAEEIDQVRNELGDRKFDQLFGSASGEEDAAIPKEHRLRLSSALYTTPLAEQMEAIADEHDAGLDKAPEPPPPAELEARAEEKPAAMEEAEPALVREELALEQADRELA